MGFCCWIHVGYPKDAYPPTGYPAQGYPPPGYPPQQGYNQYSQPPRQDQSGCLEGWYVSLSLSLSLSQTHTHTHTHTRGSKHYWIISLLVHSWYVFCFSSFFKQLGIFTFCSKQFVFFLLDNFNCLGLVLKRVALFHTAYVMLLIYFIIKIFVYIFRMWSLKISVLLWSFNCSAY